MQSGVLVIFLLTIASCTKEELENDKVTDQFYISRTGADMPIWVHGNAKSKTFVVTVHGGPILGYGLDFRRGKYIEELEKDYTMVYWDQRSSGASHGTYDKNSLTITNFAKDLDLLIRTLEKRYGEDISLFIMGHSFGGLLSGSYLSTKNHQNKIKGWINISGDLDVTKSNIDIVNRIIFFAEGFISIDENVGNWKSVLKEVKEIDTSLFPLTSNDEKKLTKITKTMGPLLEKYRNKPQYRQSEFNSVLISPAPSALTLVGNLLHAYTPINKDLEKYKLIHELPKINIPSLFVFGKYDLGNSPDVGLELYNTIGSVEKELIIYEHSSHETMMTEPEAFNSDVIKFIETHK